MSFFNPRAGMLARACLDIRQSFLRPLRSRHTYQNCFQVRAVVARGLRNGQPPKEENVQNSLKARRGAVTCSAAPGRIDKYCDDNTLTFGDTLKWKANDWTGFGASCPMTIRASARCAALPVRSSRALEGAPAPRSVAFASVHHS